MIQFSKTATLVFVLLQASTAFTQDNAKGVTVTYDEKGEKTGVAIDHVWIEKICFTNKPPFCGSVMQQIAPEKLEEAKKQLGYM